MENHITAKYYVKFTRVLHAPSKHNTLYVHLEEFFSLFYYRKNKDESVSINDGY